MQDLDLIALTKPVSEANPCGPDLEQADDDQYLNVIVTAETVLPAEYYVFSDYIGTRQPFDQDRRYADLDLAALIAGVVAFSTRTRDLRLLVLLTKLCVLARRLPDTVVCVEAIAVLLEQRWDLVHPAPEGGDDEPRRDALQRLDDPLIVTGLQHLPVFVNKRHGPITWHRYANELQKNVGGDAADPSKVDRDLVDEGQTNLAVLVAIRDDLAQARATLSAFREAIARVRTVCAAQMAGGPPALSAISGVGDLLYRFVDRIYRAIEASIVKLDPTAAREIEPEPAASETAAEDPEDGSAERPTGSPSDIQTLAEASAALAALVGYFERFEPSNPALLLLRQAQELVGKSFFEAMQILIPDHAGQAMLDIGGAKTFALPIERLAGLGPPSAPCSESLEAGASTPHPGIATRTEAVAALGQVSGYFRRAEPSSPIPMLTDGARTLTGKDFMTLLGDVLPKDVLKAAIPK